MARKKQRKEVELKIEKYAAEGKCVATLEDGKTVFVEKAIPGDVALVRIGKSKKNFAEGRAIQILTPSPDRISPHCEHFGICGGCKWQMLPYELQLRYKHQQVVDQLTRIGKIQLPEISPIIGSQQTTFYRNKLEYTFSTQRYRTQEEIDNAKGEVLIAEPAMGFHAPGLFDKVVPIHQCYHQNEPSNKILQFLSRYTQQHGLPYYDFKKQEGWLRNVIIRVATTEQTLVNLVLHHDKKEERENLLNALMEAVPEISSLHYTLNGKLNDTIYDCDVNCVKGDPYIIEKLEDFQFKISPKSFFQTNTKQAEQLYQITRDFAELTGKETLYDFYCGTGSIGIFCSSAADKIIGVETVEDAITDAKANAALNGLHNAHFFAGDVAKIVNDDFFEKHGRPDVIITDPPRAGMHEKFIEQLLSIGAPKIVYVSCNPATQARDLALLDALYEVKKVQPVDMFPHTHHIENVVQLVLR